MPKATISTEGTRVDLRSCPDGYVIIRQLGFGQMLKRRDMIARYSQEFSARNNGPQRVDISIMQEASRRYDFANCIADHNLEDDNGNKLNFSNPLTIDALDPKIAAEIEREIDKLNLEDFDADTFTMPSASSSTEIGSGLQADTDTASV